MNSMKAMLAGIKAHVAVSNRERELAELVDGCYTMVELHHAEGPYNEKWKKEWLEKAKRLVPTASSLDVI